MKQDLVYFKLYHTYAQASHGVITSRAALKMSKLTNDGTVLLHFCAQLSEYIYNDNIQLHPE